MRLFLLPLLLLLPSQPATTTRPRSWLQRATTQGRRWLNFGGTFGSALNSATVYDRIAGHPVFAVTTPWGSPYMNMEKLDNLAETIPDQRSSIADSRSGRKKPTSSLEETSEMRMVALYFVDPADALAMHGEMHQMENMKSADVRLTAFSLAKALRQASNLGPGLTTGQPPEPVTGIFPEQGALRYKIGAEQKAIVLRGAVHRPGTRRTAIGNAHAGRHHGHRGQFRPGSRQSAAAAPKGRAQVSAGGYGNRRPAHGRLHGNARLLLSPDAPAGVVGAAPVDGRRGRKALLFQLRRSGHGLGSHAAKEKQKDGCGPATAARGGSL